MKTIINSLKRTCWVKASVSLLTGILFLMLPSCQKDEFNEDSINDISLLASSKKPTTTVGKVKDVDGNWYKTVKIGNQWWMAENLKTTKYSNSDKIGTTKADVSLEVEPKYQWAYEDNETNVATYGRLYTWYAITDSRNVCPKGWHVSTHSEWLALMDYLGTEGGGKLKSTGTIEGKDGLWYAPNDGSTNETGFTAHPGGYRYSATFSEMGWKAWFWTTTEYEYDLSLVWGWDLVYYRPAFHFYSWPKSYGQSVRCVKTIID